MPGAPLVDDGRVRLVRKASTEPVANDGTLMHALERMLPYSARAAGLSVAGLRAPGTTW